MNSSYEKGAKVSCKGEITRVSVLPPPPTTFALTQTKEDNKNEKHNAHVEPSSKYLPITPPSDTRDWTYKNDPIHHELMQDLFIDMKEDQKQCPAAKEEAIAVAQNYLKSLKSHRGNSRA